MSFSDVKLHDWRAALPFVAAIKKASPSMCCWHLVLSDVNTSDAPVAFCAEYARLAHETRSHEFFDHSDCAALAPIMKMASQTQRRRIAYWAIMSR